MRVYISAMGIISPLGCGIAATRRAIQKGLTGIHPLSLFPAALNRPLPVGEVAGLPEGEAVSRTHQLARLAADQAMAGSAHPPQAVVLGVTTGGMLTTEALLEKKVQDAKLFRRHGIGSVAEDIARRFNCSGPALTVSTACSSGTAAIKIALEMLRTGRFKRILAGGADSLCRLTYFGFGALQLIDPDGARPLDRQRRGMSVAEGAAMLLLVADEPQNSLAEILGAGLSCDAHHPAKPHPRGKGALAAMRAAIKDAGIAAADIDYINLHGTGTVDNDLSEARAVDRLFPRQKPLVSSVKGACGHSLAAAGAIEAVIGALSITDHLVPANTGCRQPDPDLKLAPVLQPAHHPVATVLSNSFGFGGNNAAVVIGRTDSAGSGGRLRKTGPLQILGSACLTGAGHTQKTMTNLAAGKTCRGMLPDKALAENISARDVRRLKRFSRMALSLATAAHENAGQTASPSAVFLGTGWGALAETYDFLNRLFETDCQFPSPTDFVGSVHNAAGGLIALKFKATGANITMSGGDCSFEQALLAAGLVSGDTRDAFFVIGADQGHAVLSRLFDASTTTDETLSDGGGALLVQRAAGTTSAGLSLLFYKEARNNPGVISNLVGHLGGTRRINTRYGALLAGIPGAERMDAQRQLKTFLAATGFSGPVIDYRKIVGEFASASAVAAVMAAKFVENGMIPPALCNGKRLALHTQGVLIMGCGRFMTAMEVAS